jgi:neuronal growth regulator 1
LYSNDYIFGVSLFIVHFQPTLSHYRDQYNISWTVQSYSPIREYRLFYKRQQQPHQQRMGGGVGSSSIHGGAIGNIGRSMYPDGKPHSSIDNQLMSPHIYAPYGISQTVSADQWENVVIPEVYHDYAHKGGSYRGHTGPNMIASHHIVSQNFRHRMHFLIKNLAPSSNYEARVQARNDHGWNKLSTTFHFSTRSEGEFSS